VTHGLNGEVNCNESPPPGLPPIANGRRTSSRLPPLLGEFLGLGGSRKQAQPGRTFARATDDRTLFKWVRVRSSPA
jgi:hypothetical protein